MREIRTARLLLPMILVCYILAGCSVSGNKNGNTSAGADTVTEQDDTVEDISKIEQIFADEYNTQNDSINAMMNGMSIITKKKMGMNIAGCFHRLTTKYFLLKKRNRLRQILCWRQLRYGNTIKTLLLTNRCHHTVPGL